MWLTSKSSDDIQNYVCDVGWLLVLSTWTIWQLLLIKFYPNNSNTRQFFQKRSCSSEWTWRLLRCGDDLLEQKGPVCVLLFTSTKHKLGKLRPFSQVQVDSLMKWVESGELLLGWTENQHTVHYGPFWNSLDSPVLGLARRRSKALLWTGPVWPIRKWRRSKR